MTTTITINKIDKGKLPTFGNLRIGDYYVVPPSYDVLCQKIRVTVYHENGVGAESLALTPKSGCTFKESQSRAVLPVDVDLATKSFEV
jgi:hypothetical protein